VSTNSREQAAFRKAMAELQQRTILPIDLHSVCTAIRSRDTTRIRGMLGAWDEMRARSVATVTTADTAGIITDALTSGVKKLRPAVRPLIDAMDKPPVPEKGNPVNRPVITQSVDADTQANELGTLATGTVKIDGTPVNLATEGLVVRLSEQAIDQGDSETFAAVSRDLRDSFILRTENVAAAAVEAADDSKLLAGDASTLGNLIDSATAGMRAVYETADKRMADLLLLSADIYFNLVGEGDALDFPALRRAATELGLTLVVSPAFSDSFSAVAWSGGLEWLERGVGQRVSADPASLGVFTSYAGYCAPNVNADAVCVLTATEGS
jgi:hypothetical protein